MLSKHDTIQNIGIGALALHSFVLKYYDQRDRLSGPDIHLTMPVLPILFQEELLEGIYSRNYKGGFHIVITEYFGLPAGLQKKMESTSQKTFDSLNLAFSSNLLELDRERYQITPSRLTNLNSVVTGDNRKVLLGAARLGHWFSKLTTQQICKYLRIRF